MNLFVLNLLVINSAREPIRSLPTLSGSSSSSTTPLRDRRG
jgi:hypothetical protein